MCIAVAGKLIGMDGDRGRVNVHGNIIPVELGIVEAGIGDYVLVHAGCAIARISQTEHDELETLYEEIRDE